MSSWRRKTIAAGAIGALICPPTNFAQTHKVNAPESVVRAVGVYEWTGELNKPTGSRFVPITVFIGGELEDAGVYLPRPVPFALLTGNVYELEDGGLNKGLLVLEQAMKASAPEGAAAPAFIDGWTAYGSYKPPAAEKKAAALRPSKNLPVIQTSGSDSSRPHFSNKSDTSGGTQKTDGTQQKTDSSQKSDTASTADDSRPTMKRRTGPPAPAVDDETDPPKDPNSASSLPPKSSDDDDRAERPTLKRRSSDEIAQDQKEKKKQKESASVTAAGSMSGDPDRPRLKRNTHSEEDNEMPKLMGVPADMKQMVAVSDPKTRDPHVFARPWESMAERGEVLAKMQAFARTKLAEYGVVQGVVPPQAIAATSGTARSTTTSSIVSEGAGPPKLKRGVPTDDTIEGVKTPATSTAQAKAAAPAAAASDPGAPKLKRGIPTDNSTMTPEASAARAGLAAPRTTAAKTSTRATTAHTTAKGRRTTLKGPPQVELAGEDLKGYLLSYGGAPTYVYMAHTIEPGNVTRYVTIVAQADAVGQLKIAISSATDAAHLDRTPWMRLVDVVDIEASNRASLLFELRGQSSRQFALYRVIATRPEQIFTTSM
jgi:hypothetical protein